MGFAEPSTGKQTIVVDFSKVITSKCVVMLVASEIRRSIACLIVLRTKQCCNWFLFKLLICPGIGLVRISDAYGYCTVVF